VGGVSQSSRGGGGTDGEAAEHRRSGWRKWLLGTLKWGSITGLVLVVLGAAAVFIAFQRTVIPQPNDLAEKQVSIVYYADGKSELDRIAVANGNRESVALSKVPKPVQQAHLAAEDRTFYENNGVSVSGILRAIKTSVTGEAQVGGSTITQQYVKNYFLTQDRTLTRKAKEILIAVKIDGQRTKSEILEDYLNTIYYGRGAYGIQSGAKAYFGKDVSKLTVPEGAVLASVINAPSLYDPANGAKAKANLEKRYAYVLNGMVSEGWLTPAQRARYTELPPIKDYKGAAASSGPNGYITAAVKKELLSTGLTDQDIDQGGLRITTTIDKKSQAAALAAMKGNLPDKVTGGLVAMVPGDGAVRAMYGGADYAKSQLNTSTQAILQAASNFKPFAVLAAVRDGISTKTKFDGDSPQEIDNQKVTNFGGRSYGMVDMTRMVGRSINTAFVNLNSKVTPAKTRQAAIDAGIPATTPGLDTSLTNVLGSASPHVIDMATAYSTIASQGERVQPYFISKVTSTTSGYTYEVEPKKTRAYDKDVTADVTNAMTYTVKDGGTATKLQRLGRPIAGKTGTSSYAKSIWFTGFVPQLTVSVGMYKPDAKGNPQTLTDSEDTNLTGGTVPADVFYDFMKVALDGVKVEQFPDRAGVGDDKINAPTSTSTYVAPPETTTQEPQQTTTVTVAPTTTQAPTTTTEAPTTTAPPTTTQAPTTTKPPATSPPPATTTTTKPPAPTPTATKTKSKTVGTGKPTPSLTPAAQVTPAPSP
jgi:membrane peptidoglycan carboxypeptidase